MDFILNMILAEMKNKTPLELYRMTGINKTRIYRIMNYGKTMKVNELLRISKALKMDTKERILWELGKG